MNVAVFLSGTGTIAEKVIEGQGKYMVKMIFSDNEHSRALELGKKYNLPAYCNDIAKYYALKGLSRKDMKARQDYDALTANLLESHAVDIVALCGYMSIVTSPVIDRFLTVNVHPADLRVLDGGRRKYAGCMGAGCISLAIESGDKFVRSTTHVVSSGVDEGPLLLVSGPVLAGEPDETLQRLKEQGDWKIFPMTLNMLSDGSLQYRDGRVLFAGRVLSQGLVVG